MIDIEQNAVGALTPVRAADVAAASVRRNGLCRDGEWLYWREQRPEEQGRGVIVRWHPDTGVADVTSAEWSVRSRVHEYGGGDFAVRNGVLVFVADTDQRLYRQTTNTQPQALTPMPPQPRAWRYADFSLSDDGSRVYAVRERHCDEQGRAFPEPVNDLICVHADGRLDVIASGADFYAAPRLSPDQRALAFLQWSHPFMPWDATQLMLQTLDADGTASGEACCMAGGAGQSVLQPQWRADGALGFLSDAEGFWQLHVWHRGVTERWNDLPFDACGAPWSLGLCSWVWRDAGSALSLIQQDGRQGLALCSATGAQRLTLAASAPDTITDTLVCAAAAESFCLFAFAASARTLETLWCLTPQEQCRESAQPAADPVATEALVVTAAMCLPAPVWPYPDVAEAQSCLAGERPSAVPYFLYLPSGASVKAPVPLIVFVHSGPTGAASASLNPAIQFWVSRGYAVADINYRGSTGYGRRWRQALVGEWGRADVEDCAQVVASLLANPVLNGQIFLRGNSAGGLTVLLTLARHAGISGAAVRYPVVDLPSLQAHSHKFEREYLRQLVGDSGDGRALADRSPLAHLQLPLPPVLILQGDADPVVPLEQAKMLVAAGAGQVQLQVFAGEGHGFRSAPTLIAALEAELAFFRRCIAATGT